MEEPLANKSDQLIKWLNDHQSWFEAPKFKKWETLLGNINQLPKIPNDQVVQSVSDIRTQLVGVENQVHRDDMLDDKWRAKLKGILKYDLESVINTRTLKSKKIPLKKKGDWLGPAVNLLKEINQFTDYSNAENFIKMMTLFKTQLLAIEAQSATNDTPYDLYRYVETDELTNEIQNEILTNLIDLGSSELTNLEELGWLESSDLEENDGAFVLTAEFTKKFKKATKYKGEMASDFYFENNKIVIDGQSITPPADFKKLNDLSEAYYQLSYSKF
jgi:hypothetical protein